LILDSNIVIELVESDEGSPIYSALAGLKLVQRAYVNEIIFAEVASGFSEIGQVEGLFNAIGASIAKLSLDDCFKAGRAFAEYRRRGGSRTSILPDFLIGAQAANRGWPLVTRDRKGFASYFPEVQLIDPLAP
jgi:predicted nucleic acid-binding protein